MKHEYSMTIRMGAAHWDATIDAPRARRAGYPPVRFNFRTMKRDDRRRWYGAFMASVRKMLRKGKGR
jgi:hypothetical protein